MNRPCVVIGLLGTSLDAGHAPNRWERWRPSVSLAQQQDLVVSRFELLYPRQGTTLARLIAKDVAQVSPGTVVNTHLFEQRNPWDFEEVYTKLHDFAAKYPFDPANEDYLVHITTGTHVAQICLFMLTETRRFPAKLLQTSPPLRTNDPAGEHNIIDLDLSKYNTIAARFHREFTDNITSLKSGIATRNPAFNRLIEELEHVAAHAVDPILLLGPTGAGKSHLARRIYELKKHRRQVEGPFVEVNCATLRGDGAMSALFGHKKGSFTGATADRPGLLKSAHQGVLFLDEIGELGPDEQAMLLRAIEEKRFLPIGSDVETTSDFQLLAGTNRDPTQQVAEGRFREDLLARINLWTFCLPPLNSRREDIEPNLEYELGQFAKRTGRTVRFAAEARTKYLAFATAPSARWPGNFRDLSASITRMATLAPAGRISIEGVEAEVARLDAAWSGPSKHHTDRVTQCLGAAQADQLDRFDRTQLADVLEVCQQARSLSEAGRTLFAQSRQTKTSTNDADRLRKYLARFNLNWEAVAAPN